MELDAVR